MPETVPLDARGRSVGPVLEEDNLGSGVGLVIQRALSAASDVAQDVPTGIEREFVRPGVAHQVSGGPTDAGPHDVERVHGSFRIDLTVMAVPLTMTVVPLRPSAAWY